MDEIDLHPESSQGVDAMSAIAGQVAGAIRRAWGRGPIRARAHWAGPNAVLVLCHDGHTVQELTLLAAGQGHIVIEGRRTLHRMLEGELRAIVRAATGRQVVTVLTAARVDPDVSAAVFLLGDPFEAR